MNPQVLSRCRVRIVRENGCDPHLLHCAVMQKARRKSARLSLFLYWSLLSLLHDHFRADLDVGVEMFDVLVGHADAT